MFQAGRSPRAHEKGAVLVSVLVEALVIGAVGAVLAFAANALSPRGLALHRDYFHAERPSHASSISTPEPAGTNAPSGLELLALQLKQEGLGLADSKQVAKLFNDPRYQQELVVFIDARDDEHFQHGHIPGAYQLDYYHPEAYLATVLPVCQTAEQIVVYCNGGDCEDSKHTAMFLRDAGVPPSKLLVYAGGITEWTAEGLPVEIGPRKSGNFLKRP